MPRQQDLKDLEELLGQAIKKARTLDEPMLVYILEMAKIKLDEAKRRIVVNQNWNEPDVNDRV